MSRLHEHTAKEILTRYGVRVPQAQLCGTPEAAGAAAREIGGPVYVKAQVAIGNRLEAGAVRRAVDADEAAAFAASMLTDASLGARVDGVLVEKEVQASSSAYLAVDIRDDRPARCLRFAPGGGSGFDPSSAPVEVELGVDGVEPFALRTALADAGHRGTELVQLAQLAAAAVQCARDWHLYTLELNPVLLTPDGPVTVDAKMETDDYAAPLVPDPAKVLSPDEDERESRARAYQREDYRGSLRYVQLLPEDGASTEVLVGTHSVGGGESLVVLDALDEAGLRAANYCDTSGSPSREKVAFAAQLVTEQSHIEGLFFSTCIANQPLSVTARGLVDGLRATAWNRPAVIRFAGNEEVEAIEIVRGWADGISAPVELYGRDVHEWAAAQRMAALLGRGRDGVPGG